METGLAKKFCKDCIYHESKPYTWYWQGPNPGWTDGCLSPKNVYPGTEIRTMRHASEINPQGKCSWFENVYNEKRPALHWRKPENRVDNIELNDRGSN
jgi:hypothetical protein